MSKCAEITEPLCKSVQPLEIHLDSATEKESHLLLKPNTQY